MTKRGATSTSKVECVINAGWRASRQARIFLQRRVRGGVELAGALVDIGCLGVKVAIPPRRMSARAARERFLDPMQFGDILVPCDLNLAAAIIYGGIDYASSLGFDPDPDMALVQPMLAGADPRLAGDRVVFGYEGKPHYVAGFDDDVPAVLRQLTKVKGADGFVYVPSSGDPDAGMMTPITLIFPSRPGRRLG